MGQQLDDSSLNLVGVLVFVHHDILIGLRQLFSNIYVLLEQISHIDKQIVIVDQGMLALVSCEKPMETKKIRDIVHKIGIIVKNDVLNGQALVDRFAEHGHDSAFSRKTPFLGVQLEPCSEKVDHVFRVRPIQNAKP